MIYAKGWEEVPIGKFKEINDALLNPNTIELEKVISVLATLSGKPEKEVGQRDPIELFKEFEEHAFLTVPCPSKFIPKFVIDGVEFRGTDRIDKLSAAQLIDVWHVPNPNDYENWDKLLAIIYLKKGEEYDGRNNEERALLFREKMPCTVAYGFAVFFCLYWSKLESTIQIFSKRMEKRTRSRKGGVGSRLLKLFATKT